MKTRVHYETIILLIFLLPVFIAPQAARVELPMHTYLTEDVHVLDYNYMTWHDLPAGTEVNVMQCRPVYCEIHWGLYEYNPPPFRGYVSPLAIWWP